MIILTIKLFYFNRFSTVNFTTPAPSELNLDHCQAKVLRKPDHIGLVSVTVEIQFDNTSTCKYSIIISRSAPCAFGPPNQNSQNSGSAPEKPLSS